jgi:hypothetical protein
MKNLYWIFILTLLCSASSLFSQQISPSVISTSGGFYAGDAGMISFTTGEMAAVETYSNNTSILTQGFQQAWDFGTYITEHPFTDFSFGIYPNPSDGQFYLVTDSDLNLQMTATISDLMGKKIESFPITQQSKINVEWIDVSPMPAGTYILSLHVKEMNTSQENILNHKITIVK